MSDESRGRGKGRATSVCIGCGAASDATSARCTACGEPLELAGRYRLEKQLARGEKATTFRARRLEDGAIVCLKRFRFEVGGGFDVEDDFRREARILRQLKHEQIPRYLDDFVTGEASSLCFCLVQELIDGEDLAAELLSHRYVELEALQRAQGLLPVLEYLHGLSPPVFHRDLKPSNVVRRRADGRLFLVDFGAVRDAFVDPEGLGEESLGYMPPEQLSGEVSAASDLFALGVLVVVLLSRREPHTLQGAHGRIAWRPAMNHKPETAELLDALLEPDVKKRAQSVAQVRPLLRAAIEAARGPATKPDTTTLHVTRGEPTKKKEGAGTPPQRSPWPALVAGLLLLAGVGAAVGVVLTTKSAPPPAAPPQTTPVRAVQPTIPIATAKTGDKADDNDDDEDRKTAVKRRVVGKRAAKPENRGAAAASPAAPSQPTAPATPPPPPKPAGPPRYARFPQVLAALRPMSALQRDLFARDFPGTFLSGSGTISEIRRCRGGSARWGKKCVEIVVRAAGGRITLAYGEKDEAMAASLSPNVEHSFSRCTGVSASSYAIRCDMP